MPSEKRDQPATTTTSASEPPQKKQKLSPDVDDLSELKKKVAESTQKISSTTMPSWSFQEFKQIMSPFESKEVSDFDADMAIVRFQLLESLSLPQTDDEKEQEFIDTMMDKYSDFQKNYSAKNQNQIDREVTFKSFLKFASPLIDAGEYTQWKQDDIDRFIHWWTGHHCIDCAGNMDVAMIISNFIDGEWTSYLQQHPSLQAMMRPFIVFADWSRDVTAEEAEDENGPGESSNAGEEGSSSATTTTSEKQSSEGNTETGATSGSVPPGALSQAFQDRWSDALDSYPPKELENLTTPEELPGTSFAWAFPGNAQGRRRAAHFIQFMKKRCQGSKFWFTHSPALIRV